MAQRIAIIQGHPDPAGGHLCHALAEAYAAGAEEAGREVRRIEVAALKFPVMRTRAEFRSAAPPPDIAEAQAVVRWADHLVIVYPLWLGTMPALLKAFFEHLLRPGFAFDDSRGVPWVKLLKGRSARILIPMRMPALAYRWYFCAHGLKNLERNILKLVGIAPVRATLFGMADSASAKTREGWLARTRRMGRRGA